MTNQTGSLNSHKISMWNFLNPVVVLKHLYVYRELIRQLTWREVVSQYKGSFIGLGWSFAQPLLMLCVYTFVFSMVFNSRWGVDPAGGRAVFALALFTGLITFGVFSEVVTNAPILVIANANYVKKVVFPLEILPVVKLLTALINAFCSLMVLFAGILIIYHSIHWTIILLPLVWLPMLFFSLGIGYFLSSIGVFVRDLQTGVGIVVTMLFFMSPIFYPVSAVPEQFRFFSKFNPIALFVEDARRVVLWGQLPDWPLFITNSALSISICIAGFIWFMKSKNAFADVV